MIKIEKQNKPAVLIANEAVWTNEFVRYKAGDKTIPKAAATRYRHQDIKETLRAEASDKCIYCESKISHVFPGETDHIIPSSKRHDLVVSWENLGYVCTECNRNKTDYYDVALPLVNPYVDEPNEHLIFFGPLVLGNSQRGQLTRDLLKLSRPALVERKTERIERVKAIVDRLDSFPDGEAKEFLRNQAYTEAEGDKEFSATIKALLEELNL